MRPLGRLVASVLAPSSPTSRQHRSKPQQNKRQSREALEDWLVNATSRHEGRSQIGQRAWQSSGYAPADKQSELLRPAQQDNAGAIFHYFPEVTQAHVEIGEPQLKDS